MIKVTKQNIIDNGIKFKEDGYCYLVTEENFIFGLNTRIILKHLM